jgi:Na+/melibiose symporter-like transporter
MKLDYKKTFIIGIGFFTISIVWAIYNVAVPLYLKDLGLSGVSVGAVMTIDNIFAIVFLPLFGTLSDRTNTRYGRRMPYLLVGVPLSAIAFFILPFSRLNLVMLMAGVILLNLFMSIYRAPTVALMPDVTPRPLRSKANGIINFMGGAGTAAAYLLSGLLFSLGEWVPYSVTSGIMIIMVILMYNLVREPEMIEDDIPQKKETAVSKGENEKGQTLSLIFLLAAIFFWFTGFNAVETFFSTYGDTVLGIDKGLSSYLLLTVSALFLVFAIPAGFIAGKLGRKKTILVGIVFLVATFVSLIFIKTISVMFILLGVGGVSWALININSYPMVVEMTSKKGIGKYTGYYYFFSMLAAIVSPILFGYLKDFLGDGFLFIYASIAMVFAFFFMMLVKHGEVKTQVRSAFENIEHME